jgi:hypothetical protein
MIAIKQQLHINRFYIKSYESSPRLEAERECMKASGYLRNASEQKFLRFLLWS